MNELKGKCVNVVLGIREGRGFDYVLGSTYIIANFNGRLMESDFSEQNANPCYNTELVWESEKRDIRKVRSTNTPIRVEVCLMDENDKKEVVGFTLLSLRSAPVVINTDMEIPYKWYKLLGVSSKTIHPELFLSLTLRDHLLSTDLPRALPQSVFEDIPEANSDASPICSINDGLIQIGGEEEAKDIFHFNVVIKSATNLDLLLPKDLVFSELKNKYYLTLELLGLSIKSKPFYKDLHDSILLNEKIVLRLQSNFEILKEFFKQQEVQIFFYHGQMKLGLIALKFDALIPDISEDEYKNAYNRRLSCQEVAYFATDLAKDRKPCVEVMSFLDFIDITPTTEIGAGEPDICTNKPKNKAKKCRKSPPLRTKTETETDEPPKADAYEDVKKCSEDRPKLQKSIHVAHRVNEKQTDCQNIADYQVFSIHIVLKHVHFKTNPQCKRIRVEFRHPRAQTKLHKELDLTACKGAQNFLLDDVECKMYYATTLEYLPLMLNAWHPRIYFSLTEEWNEIDFVRKDIQMENATTEYNYTTSLHQNKSVIADVTVGVVLQQLNEQQPLGSDCDLFPYILDDRIALQEIADFRRWKEQEKVKHAANLKRLEKEYMSNFKKEWTTRKNDLEQKLLSNLNRCRALNNKLKKTSLELKVKRSVEEKQEEWRRKKDYVFEDEVYKNSLKHGHLNDKELLEKITEIKEENECLQEIIDEQQAEIEQFKKSTLTDEQTGSLLQDLRALQEKYEELQRGKNYFKEQWKKAVREIHQLKTEGQNNIKKQIEDNLEELTHLSLDSYLDKKLEKNDGDGARPAEEGGDDSDEVVDDFEGFCTRKSCSDFNLACVSDK